MADEPNPPDDLARMTTYTYDGDGRLLSIQAGGAECTYDTRGRPVAAPDPWGRTTWTLYAADGRVIDRGSSPAGPDEPDDPPDEPHIVG